MTSHSKLTGADIRAKLDHPVVDADGHMIETTFAVLDFVKQVGGADIAARYEETLKTDRTSSNDTDFHTTVLKTASEVQTPQTKSPSIIPRTA